MVKEKRYIDKQGRIVLPAHIRNAMNLQEGDELYIDLAHDGTVRISKREEECCFCGRKIDGGIGYSSPETGHKLCKLCAESIASCINSGGIE